MKFSLVALLATSAIAVTEGSFRALHQTDGDRQKRTKSRVGSHEKASESHARAHHQRPTGDHARDYQPPNDNHVRTHQDPSGNQARTHHQTTDNRHHETTKMIRHHETAKGKVRAHHPREEPDELDKAIDGLMEGGGIRGAVVIFKDKSMSEPLVRGYGQVSSADNAEDVTDETAFMIASVSKVFTASAVMKLVDSNQIKLSDNICNVIPKEYEQYNDWQDSCRNPNFLNTEITWQHMLTHTASLIGNIPTIDDKDAHFAPNSAVLLGDIEEGFSGGATCPLTDVTGFYRDIMIEKPTETSVGPNGVEWFDGTLVRPDCNDNEDRLRTEIWECWEPGAKYSYSNFGTGYLAALIEHKTKKSFRQFCKDEIFQPLGMDHTAWNKEELPSGTPVATPTLWTGNGHKDFTPYCMIDYAAGALHITGNDMAKFLDSQIKYGVPLWSEANGKKMFECGYPGYTGSGPCELVDEEGDMEENQGLMWSFMDESTAPGFIDTEKYSVDHSAGHAGGLHGISTQVYVFPEAEMYVGVLTNTEGASVSCDDLIAKVVEFGPAAAAADSSSSSGGGGDDDDDCEDVDGWVDSAGDDCGWYEHEENEEDNRACSDFRDEEGTNGLGPCEACCVCKNVC